MCVCRFLGCGVSLVIGTCFVCLFVFVFARERLFACCGLFGWMCSYGCLCIPLFGLFADSLLWSCIGSCPRLIVCVCLVVCVACVCLLTRVRSCRLCVRTCVRSFACLMVCSWPCVCFAMRSCLRLFLGLISCNCLLVCFCVCLCVFVWSFVCLIA